jgi:hypothetical protein
MNEADFRATANEIKSHRLEPRQELSQLLRDDEYYALFRKVLNHNFGDFAKFLADANSDDAKAKPARVSEEEYSAALDRLKQIENERHVRFGMFGGGSETKPPRRSLYTVAGSTVRYDEAPLKSAEAASFEVLSEVDYAKDSHRVYVLGHEIAGADPNTFRVIGGPYSEDLSAIYCGNVPMNVSDPNSFEVVRWDDLWTGTYDRRHFIFFYGDELALSKVGDSPVTTGEAWARDKSCYYYGPSRVENADYSSFEIIDSLHAKDKNHKYWRAFPEEDWPQRRQQILEAW